MIIEEMLCLLSNNDRLSDADFKKRINDMLMGKRLQEEIQSLKKYRIAARGKIARDYSLKFQQYLLHFLFADEVMTMIGEAWRQANNKDETKYRINATGKLFNKTRQLMLDVLPLFEYGALPSCLILWRSMYENYVFSKYLLGSPDEESNRFND